MKLKEGTYLVKKEDWEEFRGRVIKKYATETFEPYPSFTDEDLIVYLGTSKFDWYGYDQDIKEIREKCKNRGLTLIEYIPKPKKPKALKLTLKEVMEDVEEWGSALNEAGWEGNDCWQDVIYSQWLRYVEQTEEVYTPNPDLPDTAIFDIDGTIAKMNSRSPYDWSKVVEDEVRYEVVEYLKALKQGGYQITLLSGRDSVCRSDTIYWLDYNQIPYDGLFMRAQGDNRPDSEIKKELFFAHIAPNCNVKVCVDDRPVMVRTWASIKIPSVISVADPYKEF